MWRYVVLPAVLAVMLGLAACDGDTAPSPAVLDLTFDPAGEWTLDLQCESGDCGHVEMLIAGNGSVYSALVEGHSCDPIPFTVENNSFDIVLQHYIQWVASDCTITVTHTLDVAMPDEWSLVGLSTVALEPYGDGDCAQYGFPVQYQSAVLGARCSGCFEGCQE